MLAFYLPQWFQSVEGAQPQKAGLMVLPTMISQIIGTGLAGGLGELFSHLVVFEWLLTQC